MFAGALWVFAGPALGQIQIFLLKTHNFEQTGINLSNSTEQNQPWGLLAIIQGASVSAGNPAAPNFVTTSSDLTKHVTELSYTGGMWIAETRYPTLAALNAAVADGIYAFSFGGNTQNLTVSGGLFPNNPAVSGTNSWVNGTLFLDPSLQFNQYTGTYNQNYVNGGSSWSTAGILGTGYSYVSLLNEADFVNPPNTFTSLTPGSTYTLQFGFYRFTNIISGAGGVSGVTAYAGYASLDTMQLQVLAASQVTLHSADTDHDGKLRLTELLRVIELYNCRNGTVRTGAYAVDPTNTEDGFAPDATRSSTAVVTQTRYHSADEDHDGKLTLTELLRVIELYNYRSGTVRTGQYHVQTGTEDGFGPGP